MPPVRLQLRGLQNPGYSTRPGRGLRLHGFRDPMLLKSLGWPRRNHKQSSTFSFAPTLREDQVGDAGAAVLNSQAASFASHDAPQ